MTEVEIAVPEKLLERPRFNGRLVPFMAESSDGEHGGEGGVVVWGKADPVRWSDCVQKKLCGMCGKPLDYWIAFIGGPESARSRAFLDPGMHVECAEYALDVCPWMIGGDGAAERTLAVPPTKETVDVEEGSSHRIGLYLCHDYKVKRQTRRVNKLPQTMVYCYAGPAKRVEWRERQAPDPEKAKAEG